MRSESRWERAALVCAVLLCAAAAVRGGVTEAKASPDVTETQPAVDTSEKQEDTRVDPGEPQCTGQAVLIMRAGAAKRMAPCGPVPPAAGAMEPRFGLGFIDNIASGASRTSDDWIKSTVDHSFTAGGVAYDIYDGVSNISSSAGAARIAAAAFAAAVLFALAML